MMDGEEKLCISPKGRVPLLLSRRWQETKEQNFDARYNNLSRVEFREEGKKMTDLGFKSLDFCK